MAGRSRSAKRLFIRAGALATVVGLFASIGLPIAESSAERKRVAQALDYLATVRRAHDHYKVMEGIYADRLETLEIDAEVPPGFRLGQVTAVDSDTSPSWSAILHRDHPRRSYSIAFHQGGYDPRKSTIEACPEIRPRPVPR